MTLHWADERYVRVYTRDTVEWNMLCWQARAIWTLILRKVNRAGLLELGRFGARGLAVAIKMPADVTEAGLKGTEEGPGLIEDGCVKLSGTTLVVPNFMEAQEASASDAARAKAYRERKRAELLDAQSRNVTRASHVVTDRHDANESSLCAVPSRAVPSRTEEHSPAADAAEFDFDAGYSLYPRKEGRKKGLQRCRSQITTRSKYDAWLTAVKNYAAKILAEGAEPRFVKQFDTFMGCWEDFVEYQPPLIRAGSRRGNEPPMEHAAETRDSTEEYT